VSKPVGTHEPEARTAEMEAWEVARVRKAQGGDVAAFAELVRAYQRRTVSVAYRLLGNSEDARDVAQDALIRAYRNLGQLEDPARFGAWVTRIACNLALNFRRSRKLRAAVPLDESFGVSDGAQSRSAPANIADRRNDPAEGLTAELHDAVTVAIGKLPEKQRLSLILFSVEGMPQKEVAEVLECSVELVKWNVFQARQKLKELLADYV